MKKSSNKREIIWNVVNSLLAGALVLAGACADGNITAKSIVVASIAAVIVAISQFKQYWESEKSEYVSKLFKIF